MVLAGQPAPKIPMKSFKFQIKCCHGDIFANFLQVVGSIELLVPGFWQQDGLIGLQFED
jgi:hypothetical protein